MSVGVCLCAYVRVCVRVCVGKPFVGEIGYERVCVGAYVWVRVCVRACVGT